MGMWFAPTWHRQVSPLLHKTTLTTAFTFTTGPRKNSTVTPIFDNAIHSCWKTWKCVKFTLLFPKIE